MGDDETWRALLTRSKAQAARGIEACRLKYAHRESQRTRLHALFQGHQGFGLARRLNHQHACGVDPQLPQSAPR